MRHDHFSELLSRERLALRLDDDALVGVLHKSGARDTGRGPRRRQNIRDREVVGNQAFGMHLDLHLTHFTTEDDAVGDTGPIFRRSIVAEVRGDIRGAETRAGNRPAVSLSLSPSVWRAMKMSLP